MYKNAYLYLTILFVLTIAAFWPVYFAKLNQVKPLIHVHTILGMLWLGLIIIQTWFVRNNKLKNHKQWGKLSYVLIPLFVISSLIIFRTFFDMNTKFEQLFGAQIGFYDISGVLLFVITYGLAVTKYKGNMQMHARLMIATLSFMLFPVVGRLFLFYSGLEVGPMDMLLTGVYATEALFIILIIHDWKMGKVYPVYPLVLLFVFFQHYGFLHSGNWEWWKSFILFYGGA